MSAIERHWYSRSFVSYLLWPFSLVYRCIIFIRRLLYKTGIKKSYKAPVPVIIVGNITVGGVGKSPLVARLAQYYKVKGQRVGLVSRGYGGNAETWPQVVTADSDPALVGDEPVMLVRKTNCPMVVGPDRVAAVKLLLKNNPCDVIISDDGLQHLALQRDFEIAVLDGSRRLGNGFCLPAGPLREPKSRLKKVDMVIVNGDTKEDEFTMTLQPGAIYSLKNPALHLDLNAHTQVHAVAAIGNPQRFFDTLTDLGFNVIPHPFPDHYAYQPEDIHFDDELPVIMTEKDAVKCSQFVTEQHWCLPVTAQVNANVRNKIHSFIS